MEVDGILRAIAVEKARNQSITRPILGKMIMLYSNFTRPGIIFNTDDQTVSISAVWTSEKAKELYEYYQERIVSLTSGEHYGRLTQNEQI